MIAVFLAAVLSVLILAGIGCEQGCNRKQKENAPDYILQELDNVIKPCKDLYGFACRKRINKTLIYANNIPYLNNVHFIDDNEAIELLINYLETKEAQHEYHYSILAKTFFRSCKNTEVKDAEVFKKHFKDFGGWPLLENSIDLVGKPCNKSGQNCWNETSFNWIDLVGKLRNEGYIAGMFVDLDVVPDSNGYMVQLKKPPIFGTDWTYLVQSQKNQERYLDLMTTITTVLYDTINNPRKEEHNLPGIHPSYTKAQLPGDWSAPNKYSSSGVSNYNTNDRQSIDSNLRKNIKKELRECLEFERKLAEIEVNPKSNTYVKVSEMKNKKFKIDWLTYISKVLPSDMKLVANDTISIAEDYILEFERVINSTSKRLQANYAVWRAVLEKIHLLPENIYTYYLNVFQTASDNTNSAIDCLRRTYQSFPHVLNSIYLSQIDDKKFLTVTKYIKDYMLLQLEMDNSTEKILKEMQISLRKPNDHILEEYYKDLNFRYKDYVNMTFEIIKYSIDNRYRFLLKNVSEWETEESIIENPVYFSSKDNTIYLSPIVLQKPYFYSDKMMPLNFGTLGSIIGRGLINNCKKCVLNGKDLFNNNSNANNIQNNVDAILAYSAFNEWLEYNNESSLSNYNARQLFWISAATSWCELYTKKYLNEAIKIRKFGRDDFAVTVPFKNSSEFASSFKCSNRNKTVH